MDTKILETIKVIAEDTRKSKLNSFYAQQKIDELFQWVRSNLTNNPQPTQIIQQSTDEDKRRIRELETLLHGAKQELFNKCSEYNELKAELDRNKLRIRELYDELEEYKADPERSSCKSRMNDLKENCEKYEAEMVRLGKEYQDYWRRNRKEKEAFEEFKKIKEEFEEFQKTRQIQTNQPSEETIENPD